MSIKKSYQKAMTKEFGTKGIIFPVTKIVNLGDYGFYQNGDFVPVGNIFEKMGVDKMDFIHNALDASPTANYLVSNEESISIKTEIESDIASLITVEVAFELKSENGFLIQIGELKTESIYLSDDLKALLKTMKDKDLWKQSYRFVWQRWSTDKLRFIYARSTAAKVVLSGSVPKEVTQIADIDLQLNFMRSNEINSELWLQEGVVASPIVNFARYNMFGTPKPITKSLNLLMGDVKPFTEDIIIPDNSSEEGVF